MTDRQPILLCICVEIFGFGVLCASSAAAYVSGHVGESICFAFVAVMCFWWAFDLTRGAIE